nr:MAG: hypothetical protein DIU78_06880 [Pseudomonadota bacterium]
MPRACSSGRTREACVARLDAHGTKRLTSPGTDRLPTTVTLLDVRRSVPRACSSGRTREACVARLDAHGAKRRIPRLDAPGTKPDRRRQSELGRR